MRGFSLIFVIFCLFTYKINCNLNVYKSHDTFNRHEHSATSIDDTPCTLCSDIDANRCTVYEEATVGDAEVIITVRCFKGNVFITERKMTQPNSKRGEHVQHIYTRRLQPNESQHYESQRARNKVWFSDDVSSKLLFSSDNYLPEDACHACNNEEANACSVKEETSSDLRNLIVTIKCLNGNLLVNEQQKTKPNPYPNQPHQRIYSKLFHSEATSKSRFIKGGNRHVENISGNWNSTNSHSTDTECNECAGRDATQCSVQEEINPHSLEFFTKIKCLKDQIVVWEYTKPSEHRLNGQNPVQFLQAYNITYIPVSAGRADNKSHLRQITSSHYDKYRTKNFNPEQLIDELCSVCNGRYSDTCSVREGTTPDLTTIITTVMCLQKDLPVHQKSFQKINPNPGQKIERSYSQKIKETSETVHRNIENIDLNHLTNNNETTLSENPLKTYCKFCEGVEKSNKCSVLEETRADLTKLFTIIECQDGEKVIKNRTYTKNNPNPHEQITRWYSQSIIRSSTSFSLINRAHTKPTTDMESVNQNNACLLCEHTSATTCHVDEETKPSNRLRLIVNVSCLRGNHQVYKQTLDEPNFVPNEFVKRQYTETVQSSQKTGNIETLNQYRVTNSLNENTDISKNQHYNTYGSHITDIRNYEKAILDDSCVICYNHKSAHMCKIEEATYDNKEHITTTVKCLDSQENVLNERFYHRDNPNTGVDINRSFFRIITTTTKLDPVSSSAVYSQFNPSNSNYRFRSVTGSRHEAQSQNPTNRIAFESSHVSIPNESIHSRQQGTSVTRSSFPAQSQYSTRQISSESSHISNSGQPVYTSEQESSFTNSRHQTESQYQTKQNPSESSYHSNPSESIYSHQQEKSVTRSSYPSQSQYSTRQIPSGSSHDLNSGRSMYTNQQETSFTNSKYPTQSQYQTKQIPSESNHVSNPSESIYSRQQETSVTRSSYPVQSQYLTRQIPTEASHVSNTGGRSVYTNDQGKSFTNSRYPTQSQYSTIQQVPSESSLVNQRESVFNQYTTDSKYFTIQKQQNQNRYISNDYNTNSQHNRLVYGENHTPNKPCSICDSKSANTCSVTDETSEDTQLLVTTVKCLNGDRIVHQNQFTKTNPYPGSRIRRTYYESCCTEQTHTSNRYRSNLGIKG